MSRRLTFAISLVVMGLPLQPLGVLAGPSLAEQAAAQAGVSTSTDAGEGDPFVDLVNRTGALGFYQRHDGVMVVVVPLSGSSSFRVSDAAALGIAAEVETRDIELSDIAAIKKAVAAISWKPRIGWGPPMAMFDARVGKVAIFSEAPDEAFAGILATYPTKAYLPHLGIALTSRRNDIDPHWGGAAMDGSDAGTSYDCTAGFAVNNVNGNPRMMTAGHCFLDDETVNSPQGSTFGWIQSKAAYPPPNGSGVDAETVGGGGATHQGKIYIGYSTDEVTKKVASAADPVAGTQYCFSGATGFERCVLTMVDADEDLGAFDRWGNYGIRSHSMIFSGNLGTGACPGDSGSPFYKYVESGARVQIAGEVWGAALDPNWNAYQCSVFSQYVFIHKWTQIRDAYTVTIKTMS